MYQTRAWNFVLRKLDFDTMYYAYLNESPFKSHMYNHFRGCVGSEARLISLIQGGGVPNSGKPAYIILARSLIPNQIFVPFLYSAGKSVTLWLRLCLAIIPALKTVHTITILTITILHFKNVLTLIWLQSRNLQV